MLNAERWWKPPADSGETPKQRAAREWVESVAPAVAAKRPGSVPLQMVEQVDPIENQREELRRIARANFG